MSGATVNLSGKFVMDLSFLKRVASWPFRFYQVLRYASILYDKHEEQKISKKDIRYCGEKTNIEQNVSISWPSRLCIGKHCLVQSDCILHSMGGIHIGDYVGIGSKSILVSFAHNYLRPEYLPYDNVITLKPIIIRDFVWIGFAANIMPGVEIGEGAIVAMGATVIKNIPPLAVVAGNPAEIVGYRNQKQYERCKKDHKFAGPMTRAFFGEYKEQLPVLIRKRYLKEIIELGLIDNVEMQNEVNLPQKLISICLLARCIIEL